MDNYKPSLPDDSVNAPKESFIKLFASLLGGIAIILVGLYLLSGAAAWALVKWTPDSVESYLHSTVGSYSATPEEHIETQRKLQRIADELLVHAKLSVPNVQVHVVDCDTVNAFVVPGGGIFVCDELVKRVVDEKQLAIVIGHELGHIKNRDILKRMGRGIVMAIVTFFVFGDSSVVY